MNAEHVTLSGAVFVIEGATVEHVTMVSGRTLTEREQFAMSYRRDHCGTCGAEYDTRFALCPSSHCAGDLQ